MVKFYYNMIILGRITIDDVPLEYKKEVEIMLNK